MYFTPTREWIQQKFVLAIWSIKKYPSRKAFATHLSDSHSSAISDLTNGFSRKYATLSDARVKEKGRDKKKKKADFAVARMKHRRQIKREYL